MKKYKQTGYKIFSFKDLNEDDLYENHIDLISNNSLNEVSNPVVKSVLSQRERPKNGNKQTRIPRKKELLEKYQYLIHLLITKSFYKDYVDLPASFYQDLFGNSYNDMLINLCLLGYIHRNGFYEKDHTYKRITIMKSNIQCRVKYLHSFDRYHRKFIPIKEKRIIERHKKMRELYGVRFVKSYLKNLSQLKLIDVDGARRNVDNDESSSDYAKLKNHYTLDRYLQGNFSIGYDKNNRLYTILTNTNRNLKKYLNIRFQVDISNCHPLLFNYYIINKFNIPNNVLIRIYNVICCSSIYTQYDTKLSCKLLKDNDITIDNIQGLKTDHVLYIYLTSVGKFWDFMMTQDDFKGVSREVVKESMFREVFYSKSLRGSNMNYQKVFKRIFPSVFKIILDQRRNFKKGLDDHLANKLMSFESEIIQEVLTKLFDKGYNVLNIHDAIIVLDTLNNYNLTPEYIQELLNFEFKKRHMMGSTKIDYYMYYPNRYNPK